MSTSVCNGPSTGASTADMHWLRLKATALGYVGNSMHKTHYKFLITGDSTPMYANSGQLMLICVTNLFHSPQLFPDFDHYCRALQLAVCG